MAEFTLRPARPEDAEAMARLFAAVAEERDRIGSEPPVDLEERAAFFARTVDGSVVAEAGGRIVGLVNVEATRHGFGELGILLDESWRGRGVGSALMRAAVDWSRSRGLHKLCLEVFPTNTAAIALYRKNGFVEEGTRLKQYRRANGELWDATMMGLEL
jgi:RimJ/RimL family protein N-acetyltransferase